MNPLASAQALLGIGSAQDVMTVRSIRLPRVLCAIVSAPAWRWQEPCCKAF